MASFDNAAPHKIATETVVLTDGTPNSLTLNLKQGQVTYSITDRAYTEALETGRHESTPVLVETDDGNVTGQFSFLLTSYVGATVQPHEMMLFRNGASAYTTTAAGSKKALKMVVTNNSTIDSGGSQSVTFAYCVFTDVSVGEQDGLLLVTGSFTDHENKPTYA